MKRHYKLIFKTTAQKQRTVWCYRISQVSYMVVDIGGDRTNEMIICSPQDIIEIKPARMNLKYAELETLA